MPKFQRGGNKSRQFIHDALNAAPPSYHSHDDRVGPSQRKVTFKDNRGGGMRRGKYGGGGRIYKSHTSHGIPVDRLRYFDVEEDVDMDGQVQGGGGGGERRFAPYGRRRRETRSLPPNMAITQISQWHKVVLSHAADMDRDVLIVKLQELVSTPMIVIAMKIEGADMTFYTDNIVVASQVKRADRRITLDNGFKLQLTVNRCPPPQVHLTDELQDRIKQTMSQRFKPESKALDMRKLYSYPTIAKDFYCPLSRPSIMTFMVEVIASHIHNLVAMDLSDNRLVCLEQLSPLVSKVPSLKILLLRNNRLQDLKILKPITGLPLYSLVLIGNPLKNGFKSQEKAYQEEVRQMFPSLKRLDEMELPTRIGFDVEDTFKLPQAKGSFFVDERSKDVAREFLQQYFSIYDSDNREPLLDAYHEEALFSMSAAYQPSGQARIHTYIPESRNLLKVYEDIRRHRLLQQGKLAVVSFLTKLPNTSHDPNSFIVDVPVATPTLMLISLSGVCKERDSKYLHCTLSFQRVFVIVPHNSGFCIVNEQLYITSASPALVKKAFLEPQPSVQSPPAVEQQPSAIPPIVPAVLSEEIKSQMVTSFSQQSGMNTGFSLQCLQEHNWDFDKAAYVFTELNKQGKIPAAAFVK